MREPCLIVIAGPSGAGKTELYNRLLADIELRQKLSPSISYTTRVPRQGEINGVHYHFISRQKFDEDAQKGLFVESFEVHGNLYGTHRHSIEGPWTRGISVLRIVDVQGVHALAAVYPDRIRKIFIAPRSPQELAERMIRRGDTLDQMAVRLKNADEEMRDIEKFRYDLVIYNGDGELTRSYQKLYGYVTQCVL